MIEIDGSYGEGGGAILRQAVGMAAYTGLAIHVHSIRSKRENPGLGHQHLRAVQAGGAICGARVQGAGLGSNELIFEPGPVRGGRFQFNVGTAGSTSLVLQTVLLPCLCHTGEFEFDLIGGTDVPYSPPIDYVKHVTLPALRAFGYAELTLEQRGYYPKGGGQVKVRLKGGTGLGVPLDLRDPAPVVGIRGLSHASRSLRERSVAERQADAAAHLLERVGSPVEIGVSYTNSLCEGSGITLWTDSPGGVSVGGSSLGALGVTSEEVGRRAATVLLDELEAGSAVDQHLADQLVPFLAVSGGAVHTSDVTSHTRTSTYVAEQMMGTSFRIEGLEVSART